jgi:glucoamylase
MKKPNIKELIRFSREVIEDSSLENGAVVAANSDKAVYPLDVQDYRYVWVRDASYICMSADVLGLRDIPERFFDWCLNRAEGFRDTGFFQNAYSVNGAVAGTLIAPSDVRVPRKAKDSYMSLVHHGTQFQPDQNGSLLIAIGHHIKHFGISDLSALAKLIETTASGISNSWKDGRFALPHFDLWEERCIPAGQKRYHTYSLAVCIAGLRLAVELLGRKRKWLRTEREMSAVFSELCSSGAKTIPRTYTSGRTAKRPEIRKDDFLPDASVLGLAYPAGLLEPLDGRLKATVDEIIRRNTVRGGGLMRYPGDVYCGGVRNGWITLTGAGAWPLLNFWMAVYFLLCADRKTALRYFNWPLQRTDKHMPEQIFTNKTKPSVCPLVWSHAMFVIAAKHLGYL